MAEAVTAADTEAAGATTPFTYISGPANQSPLISIATSAPPSNSWPVLAPITDTRLHQPSAPPGST